MKNITAFLLNYFIQFITLIFGAAIFLVSIMYADNLPITIVRGLVDDSRSVFIPYMLGFAFFMTIVPYMNRALSASEHFVEKELTEAAHELEDSK